MSLVSTSCEVKLLAYDYGDGVYYSNGFALLKIVRILQCILHFCEVK